MIVGMDPDSEVLLDFTDPRQEYGLISSKVGGLLVS